MTRKTLPLLLVMSLFLSPLSGCGDRSAALPPAPVSTADAPVPDASAVTPPDAEDTGAGSGGDQYLGGDLEILSPEGKPAVGVVLMPEASGIVVYRNDKAVIDASHTADGYVMIAYTEETASRIKVIILGPTTKYTYNLPSDGEYTVFPLSDGSGAYTVGIYKNVTGTSYALIYTAGLTAALKDDFAPFLLPNQYVNYGPDSEVVKKAAALTAESADALESIADIYNYVVGSFRYDYDRAATVQSGYLPDLDDILTKRKGICFDYAAVMTAMLRSLGIPCKLVVGNAGTEYHAWISCYTEEQGWMDGVIYFDGYDWKLMDPTLASLGAAGDVVGQFIGEGGSYVARYLY